MNSEANSFRHQLQHFFHKYRKLILIVATAALFFQQVIADTMVPGRLADLQFYIRAGNDALALNDLYQDSSPAWNNTWPPFFSFFIIPLSLTANALGTYVAKELWYLFGYVCLFGVIKLWVFTLVNKNPRFLADHHLDFTSPLVFVPVLFIIPALIINFLHLQINTFILLLLILGFYLYQKDKIFLAGTMIGLATAIKAFPGLFMIYFLLRKQWKFVGWSLVAAALFTLMPALFYGTARYIDLMQIWLTMSLREPFVVGCTDYANQSLYALWEYYLACRLNITDAASPLINNFTKLSILILFIISMAVFRRTTYEKRSILAVIEFSSICILMILFSPIAWRHYWVYLYPAAAVTFMLLVKNPQFFKVKAIKFLMILWVALLLLPDNSLTEFTPLSFTFRALGFYTWSAIILNSLLLLLHTYLRGNEGEEAWKPDSSLQDS